MNSKKEIKISQFLSLVLRHKPETIGLTLDAQGWVSVQELLSKMASYGKPLSSEDLERVVANNSKKRFAFNDDHTHIRANQGHTIEVTLGYSPVNPPDMLYHGTQEGLVRSILKEGLHKRQRHHVHLSGDTETAFQVGKRRGKAVILQIDARAMQANGHLFMVSLNGVWLTEHVPPEYIRLMQRQGAPSSPP